MSKKIRMRAGGAGNLTPIRQTVKQGDFVLESPNKLLKPKRIKKPKALRGRI